MQTAPTVATRDEVLHPTDQRDLVPHGYTIEADGGFHLEVLSNAADATGYARSYRTGQLYRYQQTGRVIRNNMVRVRVTAAQDSGDRTGTLTFDGDHFGGRINMDLAK